MKKRANPDSEANLRRIDSKPRAAKQTHGFQVHFLRGSRAVTRMFSDTVYGGKEQARRAARKFKRETMLELPQRVFRGPVSGDMSGSRKSTQSRPGSSKAGGKARSAARKRKTATKGRRR